MTRWLRENGYCTHRAGIRANVGCSEEACKRLEARLEQLAEATGERVAIIGQSRGGVFARALGARRPDLVCGDRDARRADRRSARASTRSCSPRSALVGALGTGHVPGMFRVSCLRGECCARLPRRPWPAPFPADVGYIARLLAQRRRRRLARLPGPRGRRAGRGPRLALRDGRQRRGLRRGRQRARRASSATTRCSRRPSPKPLRPPTRNCAGGHAVRAASGELASRVWSVVRIIRLSDHAPGKPTSGVATALGPTSYSAAVDVRWKPRTARRIAAAGGLAIALSIAAPGASTMGPWPTARRARVEGAEGARVVQRGRLVPGRDDREREERVELRARGHPPIVE